MNIFFRKVEGKYIKKRRHIPITKHYGGIIPILMSRKILYISGIRLRTKRRNRVPPKRLCINYEQKN